MPRRYLLRLVLVLLPASAGGVTHAHAEDAPAPAAAAGGKPLDVYFKGQVTALKGKELSLRYDFSTKEQLDDWRLGVPWRITELPDQGIGWLDARLEVKGNAGARHIAEWAGEVWVTASLTLDTDRDIGGYLSPADEGDSYAGFALMETYFHGWDGGNPGLQHTIMKFGKQWREAGSTSDFVGFRYVNRRPPSTPPKAGDVVAFAFGVEDGKLGMNTGEFELRGKDPGKKFSAYRPGFYTIKGRMLVDNVVISGRLSDEWVAAEKIQLRTEKPIADPAAAGLDPSVSTLIADYASKKVPPADLVQGVADGALGKVAREALVDALCAGPRAAAKAVIDLLYRPDVESRTYGIGIIKRLLGKDYGFSPKGSEEQRSEAIRRLNEDLKKHPALLDGP